MVHAFDTARIITGISVYSNGISDCDINRLQWILNSAAGIVTDIRKYNRITSILHKLRWLPVKQLTHFRILLTTHNSIHCMEPGYLCELMSIIYSTWKLQSTTTVCTCIWTQNMWRLCVYVWQPQLYRTVSRWIVEISPLEKLKYLLKLHIFKVDFTEK